MKKITSQKHCGSEITLESKLEFLKQPENYPDDPGKIEIVETHMSWVFLTKGHAYKLKKPVRYEFLDFSTVDARHHNCEEELRLNRRLARDVYIGVLALTADAAGKLHFGGESTPIDWLVKMRRLPAEKMLDYVIKTRTVRNRDVARTILILSHFYKGSSPVEMSRSEYRQNFESNIQASYQEITSPAYGMPGELASGVCAAQMKFLRREIEMFDRRVQEGRIVEGHGDLRPEHICLETEPVIIDSLEFNREFRILDPADELSFLALECEVLGALPPLINLIFKTYARITGDIPPEKLVQFYMSHRASLRAKLAIWHLREPKIQNISKWLSQTRKYLDLAAEHIGKANA